MEITPLETALRMSNLALAHETGMVTLPAMEEAMRRANNADKEYVKPMRPRSLDRGGLT